MIRGNALNLQVLKKITLLTAKFKDYESREACDLLTLRQNICDIGS